MGSLVILITELTFARTFFWEVPRSSDSWPTYILTPFISCKSTDSRRTYSTKLWPTYVWWSVIKIYWVVFHFFFLLPVGLSGTTVLRPQLCLLQGRPCHYFDFRRGMGMDRLQTGRKLVGRHRDLNPGPSAWESGVLAVVLRGPPLAVFHILKFTMVRNLNLPTTIFTSQYELGSSSVTVLVPSQKNYTDFQIRRATPFFNALKTQCHACTDFWAHHTTPFNTLGRH